MSKIIPPLLERPENCANPFVHVSTPCGAVTASDYLPSILTSFFQATNGRLVRISSNQIALSSSRNITTRFGDRRTVLTSYTNRDLNLQIRLLLPVSRASKEQLDKFKYGSLSFSRRCEAWVRDIRICRVGCLLFVSSPTDMCCCNMSAAFVRI